MFHFTLCRKKGEILYNEKKIITCILSVHKISALSLRLAVIMLSKSAI